MKIPQLLLLFLSTNLFAQQATIKERPEAFKTYGYGDPDPVVEMSHIYPYFRFDGYALKSEMQDWKVVTLENPYIKVMVAPEIGGKVLGAFEKSSGKDYLYFNKVIKFRDVAMRGPWTSGGIEFNFGSIGHAPTTSSPVDYQLRENADGSKSCFVAAMDLSSRTNWVVEIKLPADKAFFETLGNWSNPTVLPTSLYHWSNAAADAGDDLQFLYPGTHYIGHDGDAHLFPINEEGIDISVYGNNKFGADKSYHVLGKYTDYFGGYWQNSDFGFVHWANYNEKPGKKIWMWSQSRQGQIWEDLLTDTELGKFQYVEIQSGFLFNQAAQKSTYSPFKHLAFEPNSTESFTEAWFPVHQIGNITHANRYGALALEKREGGIHLKFCANQKLNTSLRILSKSETLFESALMLKPLEVYEAPIDLKQPGEFTIWTGDELLATFPASSNDLSRPMQMKESFDWTSLWGIYTRGVEWARQRDYLQAQEAFEQCLEKEPYFIPALNGLAELLYRQMKYPEALDLSRKVLAFDTYDPQANFTYALASQRTGNYYDALDGFAIASRTTHFESPANAQLAEMHLRRNEWTQALHFAEKAVEAKPSNELAKQVQLMALRLNKENQKALALALQMLEENPLNHFAAFEKYLITKTPEDQSIFTSAITNEFPQETYLEIAAKYAGVGLFNDAARVLALAPEHPMVNLWQAWCHQKLNRHTDAVQAWGKYLKAPVAFVLPFRTETADILKSFEREEDNWKTNYYLGLIYWAKGRIPEAQQYFRECENQPGCYAFYLTRYNLLNNTSDYAGEKDLMNAWELGRDQWRCYRALSLHFEKTGEKSRALEWAQKGYSKFPDNYVLAYQLAKSLLISGKYRESLNVLTKTHILPNEGAKYGRTTYYQAAVMEAIDKMEKEKYNNALTLIDRSREWPENLGVGKPYETDERVTDYLESLYRLEKGENASAKKLEDKIIDYTLNTSTPSSGHYLGAILLKKRDRKEEAENLLKEWKETEPGNLNAQWVWAKFIDREAEAEKILNKIIKENGGTLFHPKNEDPDFALIAAISNTILRLNLGL